MEKNPRKVFLSLIFPSRTQSTLDERKPRSNIHYPRQLSFLWLKGEDERLKKERRNTFELFIFIAP